jgi:hypothetical protein
MNSSIAIVTGGDSRLLGPAGVFFLSLRHSSEQLFRSSIKYFFFYGKIDHHDPDLLLLTSLDIIVKNIEFLAQDLPVVGHFSKALAAKYIPFLFQEKSLHSLSIWFDVDQINIRDLSPLLPLFLHKPVSFVHGNINVKGQFLPHSEQLFAKYPAINLSSHGICGSFYAINACTAGSMDFILSLHKDLAPYLYLGEQGVIDFILQILYCNESSVYLPNKLFTPHPRDFPIPILSTLSSSKVPYMLHSFGSQKFWHVEHPHPLWWHFYSKWVIMGGSHFAACPP